MPDITEQKSDPKRKTIDSRRVSMALAAMCAAWGIFVATVGRVMLGLVDVLGILPAQIDQVFVTTVIHGGIAVVAIISFIAMRRCRSLSIAWPRVLLAACVVVGIASLDRVAGFLYPPSGRDRPYYVHHPRRGYMHQKNSVISTGDVDIEFNRLGFRGPAIPTKKSPDEYRILFLGDSIVFGYQLRNDETPSALVQARIDERGTPRPVRCINAGVIGYTSWQELDVLQHEGREVEPDLVVLIFYVNDVIDMAGVERGVVAGRMWDIGLPASTHWSGLVRMVARQLAAREQALIQEQQNLWANSLVFTPGHPAGLTGKEDLYRNPPLPSLTEAWRKTYLELDAIADTCEQMNAKLLIVHATDTLELSKPAADRVPSKLSGQWARNRGLPFVDLTEDYMAATDGDAERIKKMFPDGTHPSPEGARVMARRLTDEIFEHALDELE